MPWLECKISRGAKPADIAFVPSVKNFDVYGGTVMLGFEEYEVLPGATYHTTTEHLVLELLEAVKQGMVQLQSEEGA